MLIKKYDVNKKFKNLISLIDIWFFKLYPDINEFLLWKIIKLIKKVQMIKINKK